jgi:alkylation response protein AidB-like acyl-CoA dehydrogenase
MIDFSLNENQELLIKTVEDFAKKEIREKIREIEEKGANELRKKVFELGLGGIEFPENVGGAGMGMLERVLVLKTMSEKGDGGTTYSIFSFLPALYAVFELTQNQDLVKDGIEGKTKITLAKTGIYYDGVQTKAKMKEQDKIVLVIEEEKPQIILFFAEDKSGLYLCSSSEFEIKRKIFRSGLLSSPAYEVEIKSFEKISDVQTQYQNWRRFVARIQIFLSSIVAGISKCAADYALEYALERVAFERPIAYHQAISFMLADMDILSTSLEQILFKACWEFDNQKENFDDSATELFLEALDVGKKVTSDAVQVLGGHGYIKDHPTEKWMRDFQDIINAFGSPARFEGTIKNLETRI